MLLENWVPNSPQTYAFALVTVALLAALSAYLRALRNVLEARLIQDVLDDAVAVPVEQERCALRKAGDFWIHDLEIRNPSVLLQRLLPSRKEQTHASSEFGLRLYSWDRSRCSGSRGRSEGLTRSWTT